MEQFSLTERHFRNSTSYLKMVKCAALREILEGKIPERLNIEGNLPFNLQKSEKLVWLFKDVDYYEQRVKREFVGGHHGVSLRIAKGVYYRTGAFRGKPIEKVETLFMGNGLLGITNKHIYFNIPQRICIPENRIPPKKITTRNIGTTNSII